MSSDLGLANRRALVTGRTRGVGAAVVETLMDIDGKYKDIGEMNRHPCRLLQSQASRKAGTNQRTL